MVPEPMNTIQAQHKMRDKQWWKTIKDPFVAHYFGNRDIKFLVDNASSMKRYWTEATYLLETLVLLAKLFDDDGMDLYFPFSTLQNKRARRTNEDPFKPAVKGKKDETNFVKAMQDHSPNGKAADITQSIQHIFDEFFEMRKPKQRPWARASEATKALTLIILTDGIWKGMENPNGINRYVENLLKELSKRGSLGSGDERSVSIEFIQFGDDPEATERLRALDDDMEFKGYPDIIDHEMFSVNGGVRKMLLGSFVSLLDKSSN